MTLFRQTLLLLALAASGAFLWHFLASDPGYVLLTYAGWSVESTLVVAVLGVLLLGIALFSVVWLLSAPVIGWRRRQRRIARARLADGLIALADGRWARADKALARAARDRTLRLPALLAEYRAAQARGQDERASSLLAEAGRAGGEAQARLLTVEHLLTQQQFATAAALLDTPSVAEDLSPRGQELRVRALLGAGRAAEALALLPALKRCRVCEGESYAEIESAVIAATLEAASDLPALQTHWQALGRAQRVQPVLVEAYARRTAALGDADSGADAIERALDKAWSDSLARVYGRLAHSDHHLALRRAERWHQAQPDSRALLLALGQLCQNQQLWGKAEDFLQRSLGGDVDAEAWEALGELHVAQGDDARARQAYANALRARRGEATEPLRRVARLSHEPAAREERSSMGVPRLVDSTAGE